MKLTFALLVLALSSVAQAHFSHKTILNEVCGSQGDHASSQDNWACWSGSRPQMNEVVLLSFENQRQQVRISACGVINFEFNKHGNSYIEENHGVDANKNNNVLTVKSTTQKRITAKLNQFDLTCQPFTLR